ncbi:MAG: DUF1573 domain-containing protein [Nitrospirota bacterium]
MKRLFIISFFLLISSMALADTESNNGPRIKFFKDRYDFGRITQGKIVEHIFRFVNIGNEDLIIKEVNTSCGCTAALISSETIKPDEEGEIQISYNSEARSGKVTRKITVVSNDPVEPEKELVINAYVDASMHEGFKSGDSLFSERCGSCHAEPAEGKKGKELYEAVCHFCHGIRGEGKTAPPLIGKWRVGEKSLRDTIMKGVAGTEMPAFGKKNGGPLYDEQIESLLSYIRELK